MKTKNNIYCISILSLFVLLANAGTAAATTRAVKWCVKWKYNFEKTAGEEYLPSLSGSVPAKFARYTIIIRDPSYTYYTGVLDSNGCVQKNLIVNQIAYFYVRTIHSNSENTQNIYVQNMFSSQAWTTSLQYGGYVEFYQTYFIAPGSGILILPSPSQPYYEVGPFWESSASTIASRIIEKRETLAFSPESGKTYHFAGKDDLGHAYTGYQDNVTSNGTFVDAIYGVNFNKEPAGTNSVDKFKAAHEIGHGIMHMNALDAGANYSVFDPRSMCNCTHYTNDSATVKPAVHCLQSRENIRSAEFEGFGDFWSGALWNSTGGPDPGPDAQDISPYYKSVLVAVGQELHEPVPFRPYDGSFDGMPESYSPPKFLETYCSGNLINMGTEWDWVVFYWRLWTGVYGAPMSIERFLDVWQGVVDTYPDRLWKWSQINSVALNTVLTSTEYQAFSTAAQDCGIDH